MQREEKEEITHLKLYIEQLQYLIEHEYEAAVPRKQVLLILKALESKIDQISDKMEV